LGNTLSRQAHVAAAKRIAEDAQCHIDHFPVAHPQARADIGKNISTLAHAFDATGQCNLAVAHNNHLRGADNRLHSGTTEAIYIERRRTLLQAGIKADMARYVGVCRASRNNMTKNRMVDVFCGHR
jgi:hypothetical protein